MCGIGGIIGEEGNNKLLLDKMLSSMKHRGPDYSGQWINDKIALGHNRLAIIDLHEAANQPFVSNCGNYILVFNGEIYNYLELKDKLSSYQFKTQSDTEVVLAAYLEWGKACLHYFNGMFSFAIWDIKKATLFAARDRFGVKPFYYYKDATTFFFASEIKGLHSANIPKKCNEQVWANYFAYGSYGMPNETFWESIAQLPAGHCLEVTDNSLHIDRWYVFEEAIKKYDNNLNLADVKTHYTKLLKDSINLRFRADVNVGFNLSGGLDSSALLAFVNLRKDSEKVNAYTFYTNNSDYDELPWVEDMISITKNPLYKVLLLPDASLGTKLEEVATMQDEPYGGIPTVAYAEIFKQAREDDTIVLLDGQGMDEQWAGYDYYAQNNQNTIQGVKESPFRKNVLSSAFLKKVRPPQYPEPFKDALLNKQYRDLFYTKIPRALRFNDRVSMGSSTELREPFLDYRLVEFAFAQPLSYKIKDDVHKFVLREIVGEYLSDSITYAPKRPLQTPQREWLGKELSMLVDKSIYEISNSDVSDWFDMGELKKEWDIYKYGDKTSSFHIWQWLNLGLILNKG